MSKRVIFAAACFELYSLKQPILIKNTRSEGANIIASEQLIDMTYEDWLQQYKPIANPYNNGQFDGRMFETHGKELDHVHRVLENNKHSIWTYIESDGHRTIISGYAHVNRLGYFITELNWEDNNLSVFLD